MKRLLVLVYILFVGVICNAQSISLQYDGPKDIRAICGNYFVYVKLADMRDAFVELPKPVQQKYAEFMDLPLGIKATINIVQGSKSSSSIMEPVFQRHVGGYLLKTGAAYIESKEGKKVTELDYVIGNILTDEAGFEVRPLTFYEHGTKNVVFTGTMNTVFK
ncbi:MAG: hypothetical protein JST82_11550 [Bacteroidetes bacterium]|nr:hypothetical protein [Bacteroidota bacterium]